MSQVSSTVLLTGDSAVSQAVALLQNGECVALPTETVYGLAADATNVDAVGKIFEAKGRPKNHPLIIHIPDVSHLEKWAKDIPQSAYLLANTFWPGPLTLLLKKADHVDNVVTGGLETIGLRMPSHPLFLSVLQQLNVGLAAPSANPYKQLSPTIAEQVMVGLGGKIAAVLEGGACEYGLESTIIDLVGDTPRILRAGPIDSDALSLALGITVSTPEEHTEVVPGNVKAHYQPKAQLQILSADQLRTDMHTLAQGNTHFVLWSDSVIEQFKSGVPSAQWSKIPSDALAFGRQLYVTLYQVDKKGVDNIIVEQPPETNEWRAVNDRLSRAAS
ncbi:L-threonylcarbamoyladenylate synthase [Shewanella sp. HL-SH4]|uniref:L-threonylcarbamoyladenylate synthase n=1 Tax=Shewanella sp. HL-SH4 TaxID=3436240 RepID=UPI003EBFFA1C